MASSHNNPNSTTGPSTAALSLFDSELGCPRCGTLKSILPTLKLFYSSCCGFISCYDCIHTKLFPSGTKSNTITCPDCKESITEKSFRVEHINTQRYNKQLRLRSRINRIFNAKKEDFKSENEYNDYLELESDILYDLTYGNKTEQQTAEKRLLEYQKEHQTQIEERIQKNFMEQQREINKKNQNNSNNIANLQPTSTISNNYNLNVAPELSFTLPSIVENKSSTKQSLFPTREEDRALFELPDSEQKRAKLAERMKIIFLSKQAAGANNSIIEEREKQEALEALFI